MNRILKMVGCWSIVIGFVCLVVVHCLNPHLGDGCPSHEATIIQSTLMIATIPAMLFTLIGGGWIILIGGLSFAFGFTPFTTDTKFNVCVVFYPLIWLFDGLKG